MSSRVALYPAAYTSRAYPPPRYGGKARAMGKASSSRAKVTKNLSQCSPPQFLPGLTHEITIVLGQGHQGVYAEDRGIRVLAVDIPSLYLLPRRHECTCVYTTVYPRVHICIHACTQVRSKYLLSRARLYVCFLAIIRRISRDGLRLPRI